MNAPTYARELRELLERHELEGGALESLLRELLELRARDIAEALELRHEPLLELGSIRARVNLLGDYLQAVHAWQAEGMLLGEFPEPPAGR